MERPPSELAPLTNGSAGTPTPLRGSPGGPECPRERTSELWENLGKPAQHIMKLDEGAA